MKSFYSPIWNALVDHVQKEPVSFHVPGHGYGNVWSNPQLTQGDEQRAAAWFQTIMRLDVTELSTTDDLHDPVASIMEAQQLAALTFGAEETFFLVGGSTSGNLAMILALCNPGDLILVQRNVHKSIINGLRLAGAKAVFLSPSIDHTSGLATVPELDVVEQACKMYPEAVAMLLSNPNYYGMSVDLQPYAELAHRYGKPLAVDEAHGAHYGMHPSMPSSALAAGADIVVQSAHKTLPALTMGAMLHIQGKLIQRALLKECLTMIQSSSPSFPIIASLDISRAMIDRFGAALFEQALAAAADFSEWLESCSHPIAQLKIAQGENNTRTDPLRIVIYDKSNHLAGPELQRFLEVRGCFTEMANERYVVLVLGIHSSESDMKKLKKALVELNAFSKQALGGTSKPSATERLANLQSSISAPVSFTRERVNQSDIEQVPLEKATGRIAAEMIVPYPPGIPLVYAGERMEKETVVQIRKLVETGAKFQGSGTKAMEQVAVYRLKAR